MKKIFTTLAVLCIAALAFAQGPQSKPKVPMAVYIEEGMPGVPEQSAQLLNGKFMSAITANGLGATSDFSQFFLTCTSNSVSEEVIPGAPTKYVENLQLDIFIVDALGNKVFDSAVVELRGVDNSVSKAYTSAFRKLNPKHKVLVDLLSRANTRIIDYYETNCDKIIAQAQNLALAYKYEEALFQLSLIPDVCDCYTRVLPVAGEIYQKYIDDQANKNLAKARAIWVAGQDYLAASEAGEYLALIMPEAKCYDEAIALSNEMKATVKSDIDYYRSIEARDAEYKHSETLAQTEAWRAVGVAYGNNQKAATYRIRESIL